MSRDPKLKPQGLQKPSPVIAGLRQFAASHVSAPLSPWEKRDKSLLPVRRFKKQVADEDANKSESGIVKAAATGAIAGALLKGKRGAVLGAGAGVLAQATARHISAGTRDFYGERSRRGKQIDQVPALAGELTVAAVGAHKIASGLKKLKTPRVPRMFSQIVPHGTIEFSLATSGARKLEAAVADHVAAAAAPGGSRLAKTAHLAAWGGGALAVGGAAEGAVFHDKDDNAASGAAKGAAKGGLFGAGLVAAGEPLANKVFKRGARLAHAFSVVVRGGLIEFAQPEKKKGLSTGRKIAVGAGIATAAVGASLLPAAAAIGRIPARNAVKAARKGLSGLPGVGKVVKAPGLDVHAGGKFVADYLDASQSALNRGVRGKVAGAVLQHAKANPTGKVAGAIGGDFAVSHYGKFRAGHMQALNHWDWESGTMMTDRLKPTLNIKTGTMKKGLSVKTVQDYHTNMHYGREKAHAAINDRLNNHSQNEAEAIRHVATTNSDPQVRHYFDTLASHKASAATMYAKKGLAAPALAVAGGAGVVAAAKPHDDKKKRTVNFSAHFGDRTLTDFASETQKDIRRFVTPAPRAKMPEYGMTVPELLQKADPLNLETARTNAKKMTKVDAAKDVRGKQHTKRILLMNDRIVDGHHHLAKAERGGITSSLRVVDMTPLRLAPKKKVSLSDVRVSIEFAGYGKKQLVTDNGQKADPLAVMSGHQKGFYVATGANGRNYVDTANPVKVSIANGQVIRAGLNKGRSIAKWGGRGGRIVRDAVHSATGKTRVDERGRPIKKEWNKAWVRGAVATGLAGAAYIGHRSARVPGSGYDKFWTGAEDKVKGTFEKYIPNTFPNHVPKPSSQPHLPGMSPSSHSGPSSKIVPMPGAKAPIPPSKPSYTPPVKAPASTGHPILDNAVAKAVKAPLAGPKKSAVAAAHVPAGPGVEKSPVAQVPAPKDGPKKRTRKPKPNLGQTMLCIRGGRLIQLAADYADPNGWDVRDGRGHSARVFAPGSRKRFRREKKPLERVSVQRKLLIGGGIAAAAIAGTAGVAYGVNRGFRQGVNSKIAETAGKVRMSVQKGQLTRAAKRDAAKAAGPATNVETLPGAAKKKVRQPT